MAALKHSQNWLVEPAKGSERPAGQKVRILEATRRTCSLHDMPANVHQVCAAWIHSVMSFATHEYTKESSDARSSRNTTVALVSTIATTLTGDSQSTAQQELPVSSYGVTHAGGY